MAEAFICDAVRTPMGRHHGSLSEWHPTDLGAHVLRALLDRTQVDPHLIDDVVFGCINQIGSQAANLARTSWLATTSARSCPRL